MFLTPTRSCGCLVVKSSVPARCSVLLAFATLLCLAPAHPVRADVITDWNSVMSDVLLLDEHYQNPGMASRTMAMVNLAMYDAVNGISQSQPTFFSHATSPLMGASAEAAAAAAAHGVLSNIYPAQQSMLDSALTASLSGVSDVPARNAGQSYGSSVASSVVTQRAGDGFDRQVQYDPIGGVGHWTEDPLNPNQEAWGPEWGRMRTFSLTNPSTHLPPPMPDLSSEEYAAAYNEVKELGALNSATRTQEQTDIGLFWAYDRKGMGTPMRMYNGILRSIAINESNTMEENAELFAKASVAVADAGIVAWDAKFKYDLWRPVTAIRSASLDGNPDTEEDENWTPLGAPGGGVVNDFTPPFPTYISGHATFGGAMFESIANFYGTDAMTFDVTSEEMPGMTRTYHSLYDAMAENGRSRVYLGIHWNYDDIQGQLTGAGIANAVFASTFVAVPEPAAVALCLVGCGFGLAARRRHLRR
jgi:hypothetical protein